MHPRLAPLAADLEQQRTALLNAVAHQPASILDAPAVGAAWSPAQILEHLFIVELNVTRLLAKRLMRAKESGLGPAISTEPVQSKFAHTYLTQKIDAPENVRPTNGIPAAISLERLSTSHAELQALLADADGYDLGAVMARHQVFGELDMYEWLAFLARHEQRHTAQLVRTATALKGEG